jgi:hypothetical protein
MRPRLALLFMGVGLLAAACSKVMDPTTSTPANVTSNTSTSNPEDATGKVQIEQRIRKVDFKNFTYEPECAYDDNKKITVKNGEYSYEKPADGYTDRFYFSVTGVAYGDLNADNSEEAIVLTECNTGGTGNFSQGFIYTLKGEKPTLFAKIPGGDRADGGLRTARVENGQLVIESNDPGETGGACCPEFILTKRYDASTGKLNEVGKTDRRPVYPTERVKFEKGATSTNIKVHLPVDEGRRYIVGARAGQTIEASTNSEQAMIHLIGDDDATQGINMFTAHLTTTGDYTIEVSNAATKPLDVIINIKIH